MEEWFAEDLRSHVPLPQKLGTPALSSAWRFEREAVGLLARALAEWPFLA